MTGTARGVVRGEHFRSAEGQRSPGTVHAILHVTGGRLKELELFHRKGQVPPMIVECINNDESRAPKVIESGYRHPEYVHTELTEGSSYAVYGIGIFQGNLRYLIRTDLGDARWKAAYFFVVRDNRLPHHWRYRYFVIDSDATTHGVGWQAMWGYPELVDDVAHSDALQELYPDAGALKIFEREVARRD